MLSVTWLPLGAPFPVCDVDASDTSTPLAHVSATTSAPTTIRPPARNLFTLLDSCELVPLRCPPRAYARGIAWSWTCACDGDAPSSPKQDHERRQLLLTHGHTRRGNVDLSPRSGAATVREDV